MNLNEKLNYIFHNANIEIKSTIKRIDGGYESRIIWEHVELPLKRVIKSCDWNGFEDIEKCADNIIEYLETL